MYQLVYQSRKTRPVDLCEMVDLLEISRRANGRRGLTGLLLASDDLFLQVLEGDLEHIQETMQLIERDPRHDEIIVLRQAAIEERLFPDWRMGFYHMRAIDQAGIKGLIEQSQTDLRAHLFSRRHQAASGIVLDFLERYAEEMLPAGTVTH